MAEARMYVTSTSRVRIQKYFTDVADATATDDKFELFTPAGQRIVMDEEGNDTVLWSNAGINFSTTDGEDFDLRLSNLIVGFPDNNNTSLYPDINNLSVTMSGADVVFGVGAYGFEYNDDDFRVQIYDNELFKDLNTVAEDVLNCQCNCELNSAKAQRYIKARAQLDLILYRAKIATSAYDLPEINTLLTTLRNFLAGSDELCGGC
jgi:hypothetical protein